MRADILNCFVAVASVELDKFYRTAKFLVDYYASSLGQPLKGIGDLQLVETGLAATRPSLLYLETQRRTDGEEGEQAVRRRRVRYKALGWLEVRISRCDDHEDGQSREESKPTAW